MTYRLRMLAVALTLAACSSTAYAAPTDAERADAATLGVEGRTRFDAGQYAAALELFKRAHSIMRAPTTGLDVAMAYAALLQLVEARATADEVVRMPVEPNERPNFAKARAEAKGAIKDLDLRIPFVQLRIVGPSLQVAHVRIDGKTLTPDDVGKPYRVNPGKHDVVVTAPDYHPRQTTVVLVESETTPVDVVVKLDVLPPHPPRKTPLVSQTNAVPPLAIAGFVVSGGLLVTGAITGVVANVASEKAADAANVKGCIAGIVCKMIYAEQYARSTTFSAVSLASFGVGVGVGVASLIHTLSAPKLSATGKASKMSWIVLPTTGGILVQSAW